MSGDATHGAADGGDDAPTVAVVGGGVGGLSAAHELSERGFRVTVYEANDRPGGKARSVPGPEVAGHTLPGEHGFRFFPGFYRHLPETMARIPSGDGSVADHLVPTTELLMTDRDDDARPDPEAVAEREGRRSAELEEAAFRTASERYDGEE